MFWKIRTQRSSSTGLLHRGGCATYPEVGLVSREDAMVALAEPDVEPCEADAWTNDDFDELDAVWSIVIEDLGSDYDTHSNVSSVGWTA